MHTTLTILAYALVGALAGLLICLLAVLFDWLVLRVMV